MLKMTRLSSAGRSAAYYGKDDYYTAGEADAPGLVWGGKGAEALGLEPGSDVDPDTFRSLLEGINPDPDGPAASRLDQLQRERGNGPAGDDEMAEDAVDRERSAEAGPDREGEGRAPGTSISANVARERLFVGKNRLLPPSAQTGLSQLFLVDDNARVWLDNNSAQM